MKWCAHGFNRVFSPKTRGKKNRLKPSKRRQHRLRCRNLSLSSRLHCGHHVAPSLSVSHNPRTQSSRRRTHRHRAQCLVLFLNSSTLLYSPRLPLRRKAQLRMPPPQKKKPQTGIPVTSPYAHIKKTLSFHKLPHHFNPASLRLAHLDGSCFFHRVETCSFEDYKPYRRIYTHIYARRDDAAIRAIRGESSWVV